MSPMGLPINELQKQTLKASDTSDFVMCRLVPLRVKTS